MSEEPVCPKCGGKRIAMKTSKGAWYLGCPTCGKKPAPPPDPDPDNTHKEHWLDRWL